MRTVTLPRRGRGILLALLGLGAATGVIGLMHGKAGRVVLAKLGVPCPVNRVDAAQVLAVRARAVGQARGDTPAPVRPALNMRLDENTYAEVRAWAIGSGARCDTLDRGYRHLRCRGVAAASLGVSGPPISELWFSFSPTDRLTAINVYRRGMTKPELEQSWRGATERLAASLGPPTQVVGDANLDRLSEEPVGVARVRYRYRDYLATVTASHLPSGGLAVREQYMSAMTEAPEPRSGPVPPQPTSDVRPPV